MKSSLTAFILVLTTLVVNAQSASKKINRELAFEKKSTSNAIIVANVNGNVTVTGYSGDKVLVEVSKTITAKTEARLAMGKKLNLGVIDRADTLILYVDGLCQSFGKNDKNNHNSSGWGYHWDGNCSNCQEQFDYTMHFTIKVPEGVHVSASTINDGDVVVTNVKGVVVANNINGNIKLENLVREAEASTINGNLDVAYTTNPKNDCRFYSLNGDINAWFQKGLAANLSFESFNGSFYTNIDQIFQLPTTVEKNKNGEGVKFKVNGNRYRVGSGGSLLDFETFNGNVYLKEK